VAPTNLPPINALVDVVLLDGEAFSSRVEDIEGVTLTVGAPYGVHAADIPKVGTALEIAWVAEDRRHAVDVRLTALTREQPPRWEIQVIGSVRLQTRRNYVRGGGGEHVEVVRGADTIAGKVIDLSEGGVRMRVTEDVLDRDDRVDVVMRVEGERLTLRGTVLFVRRHPETASFDVIITYEAPEAISRTIRGYVLRREMEARRRLRESVMNA
jgi:hypothetical protein